MDLRADRRRRLVRGERFGGDAVVLRVQLRAEARLVVAGEDALAVHFEHAAGGEAAEQRVANLAGSTPALRASANASLTAASVPPITIWLQTLQSCPAPDSPMRMMRSGLPIASRIGFTSANAAASPPTMIDSVPLMAPISPPLTGASSMRAARVRRRVGEPPRDGRRDAAHVDEDRPGLQRREDPVGPSSTCSTSGESGSIVMMRVGPPRDRAGRVRARRRPRPARRPAPGCGCARPGEARLSRLCAMGLPMRPSPMNPTVSGMGIF